MGHYTISLAGFPGVPEDVLQYIFSLCDFRDVIRFGMTCKALEKIIRESSILQYHIELGARRMVSLPDVIVSDTTVSQRLEVLNEVGCDWSRFTMAGSSSGHIGLATDRIPCISIVGDLLSIWNSQVGMLWMLPPIDADTSMMEVTRSAIYVMPIRIEGVAIDVTQNLSALVARAPPGYHIYLRTVDKNEPYDVKVKILGQSLVFLGLDLQCENSFVGETLQIWNWQETDTAEPQCVIKKAEVDDNILDFCFLAHDALLLLTTSGILEVYTFSEFTTPVCRARYALPKLRPGFRCSRGDGFIVCNFPCVATAATRRSVDSSKLTVLPFCPNPQDRICAVSFGYVFYIDMQFLFTSGGVASTSGNGTETSILSWSTWGPQNSRCFPNDGVYDVHGSRAVGISRIGGRTYKLRMREFNPYAIRRAGAVGDRYQWLVTEPSRIPPGWAFAEEVVTYLPYREAFSYEWFDEFDSTFEVTVDDSRLVLVQKLDVANNININFQARIVLFKFCSAKDAKI